MVNIIRNNEEKTFEVSAEDLAIIDAAIKAELGTENTAIPVQPSYFQHGLEVDWNHRGYLFPSDRDYDALNECPIFTQSGNVSVKFYVADLYGTFVQETLDFSCVLEGNIYDNILTAMGIVHSRIDNANRLGALVVVEFEGAVTNYRIKMIEDTLIVDKESV